MKDFSKDSEYILKGRIHGRHIPAYDQGAGKTIDKYDLHLCRLCRHIGSYDRRLTRRDRQDPKSSTGLADDAELFIEILVRIRDEVGHGDLLAGYKFLYNPLFLIKLNQIGTLLLKTAGNSGLSPTIMPQGRAAYPA